MRTIAMCLLALALAKLTIVHHLRLEGARDVIIAAYGRQAIAACETADQALRLAGIGIADMTVDLGDRSRAVALWQVDHSDWAARYRSVKLVLRNKDGHACRFDPVSGVAVRAGPAAQAGS